jgi:protein required for attachment to host cells
MFNNLQKMVIGFTKKEGIGVYFMAITWILVAHGSSGKILEAKKNGEEIFVRKDFIHPKTAKKNIDLTTSQRTTINEPLHHAMDYSGEIEDHERQAFAREIGHFLAKAFTDHRFNNLIVVASRDMLGELRKAIADPVSRVITHQLDKDLISQGYSNSELIEKIRDDLQLVHL